MSSLTILLTSSVIAALLSAIISFVVSLRLKQLEFKNEYYKQIITKRLAAYDYLERQIAGMKFTALDETDKKPYHIIFSYGRKKFFEHQLSLTAAFSQSLWIDNKTIEAMDKLNDLFFHLMTKSENASDDELIDIGKKYYMELADLRNTLEKQVRNDLFSMHKLEKFFKTKTQTGLRAMYKRND